MKTITRLSLFVLMVVLGITTSVPKAFLNNESLKSYYATSALPLSERKATFRNASPDRKSDLWRTHLELFLTTRQDLTGQQKDIILAAMALATPEYFGIQPGDSAWKTKVQDPQRSLEKQIVAAFSFEDATKIFATLGDGPELGTKSNTCTGSVLLRDTSYRPFNALSSLNLEFQRGTCTCSTSSDWCALSSYCKSGSCTPTQSGCGFLWSYPCNGVCS